MQHLSKQSFVGFNKPETNFFRLPNEWTDITAQVTSLAELKLVEYVLKHTWGYSEFDMVKKITTDEFMSGRKRKSGERIDNGTGLSKPSVIAGLKSAVLHGLLEEETDDSDKARIKKYYKLKMRNPIEEDQPEQEDPQSDVKILYIGVKKFDSDGKTSLHRSEKDTLRKIHIRNSKSKLQSNGSKENQGYQSFQAVGDLLKQKREEQGREVQHLPEAIEASIDEVSTEFNDARNRRSNRTHVLHMYHVSGKTAERFTSYLYEARSITKQQGRIKKKMPYFFRVLEDITGVQPRALNIFSDASPTPQNVLQQKNLAETGKSLFHFSNRNLMSQTGKSLSL
jgi:hypothetical protein